MRNRGIAIKYSLYHRLTALFGVVYLKSEVYIRPFVLFFFLFDSPISGTGVRSLVSHGQVGGSSWSEVTVTPVVEMGTGLFLVLVDESWSGETAITTACCVLPGQAKQGH